MTIPLFKSHYSIGRSILTLEEAGKTEPNYPDSVFDIAKENNLKDLVLVEDSMSGFLEAYTNAQKAGLNLIFGQRLILCADINEKSEDGLKNESKIIVFMKNNAGYKDLIKISTLASTEGFYYEPRTDIVKLKELWTDNLILAIPFYDSFIMNNLMRFSNIIIDILFTKPLIFIERLHSLPFDSLLGEMVETFVKQNPFPVVETHSIYYKNKLDFKAYQTFKAIHKRSTLAKPKLEHMSDNSFCWESYAENH